jgi:hypothetical protein
MVVLPTQADDCSDRGSQVSGVAFGGVACGDIPYRQRTATNRNNFRRACVASRLFETVENSLGPTSV